LVDVYRGVGAEHPQIANARQGIVNPRGGSATVLEHNLGNTNSVYTSWTTDISIAEEFAGMHGPGGVILRDRVPRSFLIDSPDLFGESEVLRMGIFRVREILPR
jgi:hypothetical protein